jgi:hypothetical protein
MLGKRRVMASKKIIEGSYTGLWYLDDDDLLITARRTDIHDPDEIAQYGFIVHTYKGDNLDPTRSWLIDDIEYLETIMRGFQKDLRKWRIMPDVYP